MEKKGADESFHRDSEHGLLLHGTRHENTAHLMDIRIYLSGLGRGSFTILLPSRARALVACLLYLGLAVGY